TEAVMEQGARNQEPRLNSLQEQGGAVSRPHQEDTIETMVRPGDRTSMNRMHLLHPSSTYYYACGPLPMLKAVMKHWGDGGEVSMEERMGCGFGACMGCSIQTKEGTKRVCKDGPVFKSQFVNL
ncbi:MAG: hypothetical protein ACI4UO_06150, partial [Paludibacteraceae bacterium]